MKRYLITGLVIWAPLAITIWVLQFFIGAMDQSLRLLPAEWQPKALFGFYLPGVGALLTVLIILVTGMVATNIFGETLVRWWEQLLARIPVVNSLYRAVKQVSDTLLSPNGQAFRQAVLVEYPRREAWTIAFLTGRPGGDAATHLAGDYVSVYVPTTPNPTSGFFLMVPRRDVIELDMSVDAALKYVISMGVVAPPARNGDSPSA